MTTSVASKPTSTLLAWTICLCAGLFFAYELMQFHMLNAIATMLLKDLHMNATHFGILGSTYLLADVLFLLPAGILLDKFSPKKVILAALFICVLGTLGFAFSQNFLQACVAHFLSGIGNAFCFLSCIILISRWFPANKQAFVVGVIVTLGMLGGVIAQAPFSYLSRLVSWRSALVIDAMAGSVLWLAIVFIVKDAPHANIPSCRLTTTSSFFKDLASCLFNRQNLLCGLYTALTNLPLMVIGAAWGGLFLEQVHNISSHQTSFIAGMICMGTIVGSSAFGYISDRLKQRKSLMFGGALTSLIIMTVIMVLNPMNSMTLMTLFFLLGLTSSTQVLSYPLITQSNPKHLTGTSMSIAAVIIMGLAGVAQSLSGKLIDLNWNGQLVNGAPFYQIGDFKNCFMMFPVGLILAAILVFFIQERNHAENPA